MRRLLPALVALALLAAPAGAIDLTGSWQQTKHSTCVGLDAAGEKVAIKNNDRVFPHLRITQSGVDLYFEIESYFWRFEGLVYGEPGGTTGQGILQRCRADTPMGDPSITYRISKAQTFPVSSKGVSGKLTALYVYGGVDSTYSCTITFERFSLVDPGSAPCP
jgi:hypothetical protein